MPLQTLKQQDGSYVSVRPVSQIARAISGFGATVTVTTVSDSTSMMFVVGEDYFSNATIGTSLGGTYYAGASEYDPAFVNRVLRADAAPVEATFDNVVDLLDWLERD